MNKTCSKCKKEYLISQFFREKRRKDGLSCTCKPCSYIHLKKYKSTQKGKDVQKRYYIKNKQKIIEFQKKYHRGDRWKLYLKKYRELKSAQNPKIKKVPDSFQTIKDKRNAYRREYRRKKRIDDVYYRLVTSLRKRLHMVIKGNQKSGSAIKDLGCTISELKLYIEAQFKEGMSWSNYGYYTWHIDHRKPLASFNLDDREQFLQAVHYTNLQPMWWRENILKSNKYQLSINDYD